MSEEQPHPNCDTLAADAKPAIAPAFNHWEDAVFSLRMVAELLPKVRDEEQYWKWVIVALHSALQGFMVLALRHGADLEIIDDGELVEKLNCPHCGRKITKMIRRNWGTRREWLAYLRHYTGAHPKPKKLLPFKDLYERIKKPEYMERLFGSKSFRPTGSQGESVKWLNSALRNQFIHFLPVFWIDHAPDLLRIVEDCLQVISFLVNESGNIAWMRETKLESQAHSSMESIRQSINSLKIAFASTTHKNEPGSMD